VDWDEVWHWHHLAPTAPPLVYTWRIEQILIWDDQIKAYSIEQERTDAWHESRQNMGTTYLLICTKLEVEPKRLTKRQVTTSEKLRDIKMKYGIEGRTREM
jgi:hypothetical protein